jgi:hypothetical protein
MFTRALQINWRTLLYLIKVCIRWQKCIHYDCYCWHFIRLDLFYIIWTYDNNVYVKGHHDLIKTMINVIIFKRARLECGRSCVLAPVGSNQRLRNWYLMHALLRRKKKEGNQNNVSEWSYMSTRGLNDDMCFVLDQHPWIYMYSASSVKQQSAGRHVAPLGHIILIPFFLLCTSLYEVFLQICFLLLVDYYSIFIRQWLLKRICVMLIA